MTAAMLSPLRSKWSRSPPPHLAGLEPAAGERFGSGHVDGDIYLLPGRAARLTPTMFHAIITSRQYAARLPAYLHFTTQAAAMPFSPFYHTPPDVDRHAEADAQTIARRHIYILRRVAARDTRRRRNMGRRQLIGRCRRALGMVRWDAMAFCIAASQLADGWARYTCCFSTSPLLMQQLAGAARRTIRCL